MHANQVIDAITKKVDSTLDKKIRKHMNAIYAASTYLRDIPIRAANNPTSTTSGECLSLSAGNFPLPDVATPVLGTDAANKDYVDAAVTPFVSFDAGSANSDDDPPSTEISIFDTNSLIPGVGHFLNFFFEYANDAIKIGNTPMGGTPSNVNIVHQIGYNYGTFVNTNAQPNFALTLAPNTNGFFSANGVYDMNLQMADVTGQIVFSCIATWAHLPNRAVTIQGQFNRGVNHDGTAGVISGVTRSFYVDIVPLSASEKKEELKIKKAYEKFKLNGGEKGFKHFLKNNKNISKDEAYKKFTEYKA